MEPSRATRRPRSRAILGGDLNSGPSVRRAGRPRAASSKDAWVDSRGRGPRTRKPAPPRSPRGRIDFLLYSDPLVPPASEVLSSSEISDHRAVRASFQLPASDCTAICVPVFDEPLS